jgi:DNA-binding NarL/FixJ family response regulator
MTIRIMIADDHAIVRDGLKMILESENEMAVVAMATDGRNAIALAMEHNPDLIVMDIAMPGLNGIEATEMIRESLPEVGILMLSMHQTREYVYRAIQAGALGYLLKESAGGELVAAVRAVMKGHRFFGKGVEEPLGMRGQRSDLLKSPIESLSRREREILQLVTEGKTSADIAATLSLSPKSVETYRSRLMQKLGVANIPALVKFALRHGITPPN